VVRPAYPVRCERTGLMIPECCCRHCCEDQVRRYAPWLFDRGAHPKAPVQSGGEREGAGGGDADGRSRSS